MWMELQPWSILSVQSSGVLLLSPPWSPMKNTGGERWEIHCSTTRVLIPLPNNPLRLRRKIPFHSLRRRPKAPPCPLRRHPKTSLCPQVRLMNQRSHGVLLNLPWRWPTRNILGGLNPLMPPNVHQSKGWLCAWNSPLLWDGDFPQWHLVSPHRRRRRPIPLHAGPLRANDGC